NSAFANCSSLTSVSIPSSVTGIATDVFSGCTSLTNISVDAASPVFSSLDGVLFEKAQTAWIIFPPGRGSCVIPDSVTSVGSRAFYGSTRLASVASPASVTSIEGQGSAACASLTNFTFLGNAPRLVPDSAVGGFTQFANVGAGAKAYYYCGTTGWGTSYGG